jgi:hypothetical protein
MLNSVRLRLTSQELSELIRICVKKAKAGVQKGAVGMSFRLFSHQNVRSQSGLECLTVSEMTITLALETQTCDNIKTSQVGDNYARSCQTSGKNARY